MASNPYVNKVQKADGSVIIDISDTTAVASDVAQGKYFYTASGQKTAGTASGGGGTGGTITQDQDGYLVLSPDGGGGGGSEPGICVCGTFTTGTTGGVAQTISIPYSGSGYPFMVTISLAEGVENQSGTAYGTLHAYAITQATYCKASTSTLPDYTGGSSNNNLASRFIRYKSSTTNPGTVFSTSHNVT